MESKIEVLATVKIQHSDDLYKIVDCLNRTLKRNNLMFGLALDEKDKKQAIFTIYEKMGCFHLHFFMSWSLAGDFCLSRCLEAETVVGRKGIRTCERKNCFHAYRAHLYILW